MVRDLLAPGRENAHKMDPRTYLGVGTAMEESRS